MTNWKRRWTQKVVIFPLSICHQKNQRGRPRVTEKNKTERRNLKLKTRGFLNIHVINTHSNFNEFRLNKQLDVHLTGFLGDGIACTILKTLSFIRKLILAERAYDQFLCRN